MTERLPLRVGLFIGQAGSDWSRMLERVLLAEELGFDHAYLIDHLLSTDGPEFDEVPVPEAWTLLAALAARTTRIRLGVLVTSNTFRHPALLAKQAATVDEVSGGRLVLGLGTGWYEDEHRRFGLPFPAAAERVDALDEALVIIRRLLDGGRVSYAGRHYRVEDALLRPLPLQRPLPILVAAHRPRMLRLAARHADIWDTFPNLPRSATSSVETDLGERVRIFEEACREVGRDPASVRRSTWAGAETVASEAAYREWAVEVMDLGFTDLATGIPDDLDETTLRRIARDVVPELRESSRVGTAPAGN